MAELFPMAEVRSLEHPFSDHTPLLWVSNEGWRHGTYFKFDKAWLLEEGFRGLVEERWSFHVDGSAAARLEAKLRDLRTFLKVRIKQIREERGRKKEEALGEIARLDRAEDVGLLSDADRVYRARQIHVIQEEDRKVEMEWRVRSR
jgi:hypothetical protein